MMTPNVNKVVVVSSYDVADPVAWSGVPYFFTKALGRVVRSLVVASPLEPRNTDYVDAKSLLYRQSNKLFFANRDADLLRTRAANANALLSRNKDADAIIVFHPPDAAFLDSSIPIVIIHDSTWKQFITHYRDLRACIAQETLEAGCVAERLAFEKAELLIFFTEWAADAARQEYPSLTGKIWVVPPGANVEGAPGRSEVQRDIERRLSQACSLLFVGAEVYRKGFDVAANVVDRLRQLGVYTVMAVVGISQDAVNRTAKLELSDDELCGEYIVSYGSLNKAVIEERRLLSRLYSRSTFLIVPSRADCGSLALCDAAAFGLPTVTSGAGGIRNLVSHGVNGLVVGPSAAPQTYAECIKAIFNDKGDYGRMCHRVRLAFEEVLNWDRHVVDVARLIDSNRPV